MPSPWVTGLGVGDDAPVRLFCFPHAGAGGRTYTPWRQPMLPGVQVCPIVLPGRESRMDETPYTRIEPLTTDLAGALGPYLDRPYAVFGHSLGALVAYETVRALRRAGHPEPQCLFASGRRAPHLLVRSQLHRLPTDQLIDQLLHLGGTPAKAARRRDLLKSFVPMIRADYEVNETYRPLPGPLPSCPIVGLIGDRDPVATPTDVAAWQWATTGPFRLRIFAGDHFYLKNAPAELLATVTEDLHTTGALGTSPVPSH